MNPIAAVAGYFKSDKERLIELREKLEYSEFRRAQAELTLQRVRRSEPKSYQEAVQRCRVAENDLFDALETIDATAAQIAALNAAH